MIRRQNELGEIAVSNNVYTYIAGSAATNCFGVKGMAIRSMKDGLVHLLRRESLAKGVLVRTKEDGRPRRQPRLRLCRLQRQPREDRRRQRR